MEQEPAIRPVMRGVLFIMEMDRKVAFFLFREEPACVMHGLLNALDMHNDGYDVKVIIEGRSTGLLSQVVENQAGWVGKFNEVKDAGLIDCVCKACAAQNSTLETAYDLGLPVCDELSGHPAMANYVDNGYRIITL